jgi:hypothetical protein
VEKYNWIRLDHINIDETHFGVEHAYPSSRVGIGWTNRQAVHHDEVPTRRRLAAIMASCIMQPCV